jgi:glycosyltransferase involved in cell wall biosynthesis
VINAIGAVVPAHNEELVLPRCLASVRAAALAVPVPVHVVVAADACTDRTAALARAAGAHVIAISAHNVGIARAAGFRAVLDLATGRGREVRGPDPGKVWLASTDADSLVPPTWLARQLRHAERGWELVLGTVVVRHWDEHPPHLPAAFAARYDGRRGVAHSHVHGANLGILASAYLACGGFAPLRTGEDHALRAAASRAGRRILHADDIAVETSARRASRAPDGFSDLLKRLGQTPSAGAGQANLDLAVQDASQEARLR